MDGARSECTEIAIALTTATTALICTASVIACVAAALVFLKVRGVVF